MKPLLPLAFTAILLLSTLHLFAQVKVEKEPSWVTQTTIDYNSKKLEDEAEDGYIDVDYENQVSIAEQSSYVKTAIKVLTATGVEHNSEISADYDPSYEQLVFHSARIIRQGKVLNKLNPSRFKIIQEEKDRYMHLYNGKLTALLILDDLRKDDIIEYSYTVKGFNPIMNGKYADVYGVSFSVPVQNIYYKLVVPPNSKYAFRNHEINISPTVSYANNGQSVYEWRMNNVAPVHLESKVPGWYDPFASIEVSEFADWKAIAAWAAALFPKNVTLSAGLQKKINSITARCKTDEDKTVAALRFVEDEVRYMGIEMGEYGHRPNNPNKVFSQRFGDCKDKSYLLVTMLNAMGIEANPVLINTTETISLKSMLPSPYAFDHCTVQARLNGKTYWFDPTISYQRGKIDEISYPDYKVGLVINPSTDALSSINMSDPGMVDIKEIFTVTNVHGKAQLKVITKYTGSFADDIRYDFNNSSLYELKKTYKDFYAGWFDKITADSLAYRDDEATGEFTSTEYYTLEDFTSRLAESKISVTSFVINSILTAPSDKKRTMPFTLRFPAHYKEQIVVNMPDDFPITPFDEHIACEGFQLHTWGNSNGKAVELNHEYTALKDNVMPGESAGFFSKHDAALAAIDHDLYKGQKASNTFLSNRSGQGLGIPSLGLFPSLYIMLGIAVLLTYLIKSSNARRS